MIKKVLTLRTSLLLAFAGTALLTSCKKDPVVVNPSGTTPPTTATNGYVDNWILSNMRDYYYWTDKIPAKPDTTKAPSDFFYSLLYDYGNTANPQRDRFSWIQESSAELKALLSGESKTTGADFRLINPSGTSNVYGIILYVLPGSPADKAGLKRGDAFYSVNGVTLTTDQTVINKAFADETVTQTYGIATLQNGVYTNTTTTKSITPVVFQENPIFKDSVYTDGTRKIGYLMYNQFVPGPNNSNSTQYDDQVNAIFGKFKQQGVNEMVLDLRYNGGGSVASSTQLASLLVKGLNGQAKVPYARTEWNALITNEIKNNPKYGNDFFYNYFSVKANNIGDQLQRLYVLTTRGTASASELIINGLRPFMTVNTIGATSYGKNVGSITITDDKNPKNQWGMQPIVFRSFNKNNESDYWTGFTPTVAVNEFSYPLVPIGDTRDPLLAAAINHMKGLTTGGRLGSVGNVTALGSSLDRKAGGQNMFIDLKLQPNGKLLN
ncbi:peptidase S41 [Fibrella sp. HMF5335]|uniref:Peptidase S41 n=1 Tax=Fibrella rubiginis TaxID=2817060 RepID=A0A939GDT8_9BACT|nr:S41 family peptidase [Fibrella rubiginis]MBO0935399.1 peptidase S41 [Fibrella rubiginis]